MSFYFVVCFTLLNFSTVISDFVYHDFNETTGLWFVGSAGTTSCHNDELLAYGDKQGYADQFNEDVIKERGESTDSVFESSVETHKQEFNEEIEESQAGFLHRPGTILPYVLTNPNQNQ